MSADNFTVIIMRRACLMEDEGRDTFVDLKPRPEAEAWIAAQENEFFKPSDYYIAEGRPAPGDKVSGHIFIGTNGKGEVVMNHPKIEVDFEGNGYIVFSSNQARNLAHLLLQKAREADEERGFHGG